MEEVQVGDELFDDRGNVCRVTWKSQVWPGRPSYKVTTDDGDEIIADQDHEWRIRVCGKRPCFKIHTTKFVARSRKKRGMIERQGPLNLPHADLLIDPYVLGAWLGDGCSKAGFITQGQNDLEWMRKKIESAGYETTLHSSGDDIGVLGLQSQLKAIGVYDNKHIPIQYLRASKEQRLALLQGLIDTDGYVPPGGEIEFCSTNKRLAEGVRELVSSLGRKVTMRTGRATINGKDCGEKYRVVFFMANAAAMPRKLVNCRDVSRRQHRYVSAEFIGHVDTVCIEVDSPSHMFLCGKSMLPTHNSTLTSLYFPAWFLGTHPDKNVILVSYADEFAAEWGRKVRDTIDEHGNRLYGVKIRQDSKSADRWQIAVHGGGMKTVGIGGGLLGRGADLAILDDAQQQEDAFSETIREKAWQWFTGTMLTRLNAGGRIVVIMQRWHELDLVGRILERAKETGEHWEIFNVPAIATDGENDPIGRKVGEALWPERFGLDFLDTQRKTQGSFLFSAVYQQTPSPEGGGYFQRSWFRYYDRVGEGLDSYLRLKDGKTEQSRTFQLRHCRRVVTVDLAFSLKTENDFSVLICCAITPDCDMIVLDVHRERMTGDQLAPAIKAMMDKWDCQYCGIEDVQAQTLIVQAMRRAGFPVRALKANMDKVTRSVPCQIRMEAGQVWFPKSHPELENLEHELLTFPKGAHDDLVDCLAYQAVEVQRLGGAALSQEERDRIERERNAMEWREKVDRQKAAHENFDLERWWVSGAPNPDHDESRFWH